MAFLSGWTRAIPISIPAAYVTGSITNFPGLIDLAQAPTATRQAIAASAKADGSDLRVTLSDGTTVLSHWLRPGTYSTAGGLASGILQPLYPSLTSGVDGSFVLQYGNASAPDVSSSSAVFGASGAGYAGAWGFGDGVTLDLTDLTGNGNDGTNYGATAAAGVVQGAASFDGNAYIVAPSVGFSTQMSVSAWCKIAGTSSQNLGVISKYEATGNRSWNLSRQSTTGKLLGALSSSGAYEVANDIASTESLSTTSFIYCAMVYESGVGTRLYMSGSQVAFNPVAPSTLYQSSQATWIGAQYSVALGCFIGLIDEPRIAPFAASPAFISLDYNQVANQSSVVLWGSEVSATTRRRLVRPLIRPLIQYTTGVRA